MNPRALHIALAAASTLAVGCSDSFAPTSQPADVAGTYSINLTETDQNSCQFMNWQSGKQTTDVPFTVSQDGDSVTGTVTGVAGSLLELILGSGAATFHGTVTGNDLQLVAHGSNATSNANCSYTIDATVAATVDGATIQGTLDFSSVTNGSPDCDAQGIEGCVSSDSLTGARPQ